MGSSALLAVALADSCTDCTAVVSTIAARLSSEESLAAQGAILVGGLCPGTEDPASCEAGLPGLWNDIAALLWPGYWDPTAEWMCADFCAAPETMDVIVENIAPQICANNPTNECPIAVDAIIRNGLPLLAGAGADADFAQACNAAVEGTCPARKLSLF